MRYVEFKAAIEQHLRRNRSGATWPELRDTLGLPYDRPCPEWTRRLEEEIGLTRRKGAARSLIWALRPLRINTSTFPAQVRRARD